MHSTALLTEANGVCNAELSEIEALLWSLSLCEMPVPYRSLCCKGESVGAVAVHYIAGAIQAATEVAPRTENGMVTVIPRLGMSIVQRRVVKT